MAFELQNFNDPNLDADFVAYLIEQQSPDTTTHYARLWDYFRNPLLPITGVSADALNANSRPYFQAQEVGLPARITGIQRGGADRQMTDLRRKEVVIENDIAWRISAMVDFLFGRSVTIRSKASDPALAEAIEAVISAVFKSNGADGLFHEMALFGAVYGYVDIALRLPADGPVVLPPFPTRPAGLPASGSESDPPADRPGTSYKNPAGADSSAENGQADSSGARSAANLTRAVALAGRLQLETVEASRVIPILAEDNYHRVRYWIQRFNKHTSRMSSQTSPWASLGLSRRRNGAPEVVEVVEIMGPTWWQRYEDRRLVGEGANPLGRIPVVHIQNIPLPGNYAGLSDVEPLVPLQDELNTRLSDRAHRVTYQSFKMYLGKGIDDFLERPVGPGQMWATQNLNASIEEFGSDDTTPSENAHIDEIRQAMDKISSVTSLAAGLIRGGVGNLTSATALKILFSGLLARTSRKRLTYGTGIGGIAELVLQWLDGAGVLKTTPADRAIEIHWPSPLPIDEGEQLRNAQIKAQLGVPVDRILADLGYDIPAARTEQNY